MSTDTENVPGYEGSVGPGRGQYRRPHVYARDVQSGAGNCVCGGGLGDPLHTEAAPGVPVPDWARPQAPDERTGPDRVRDAGRADRGGDEPTVAQGWA